MGLFKGGKRKGGREETRRKSSSRPAHCHALFRCVRRQMHWHLQPAPRSGLAGWQPPPAAQLPPQVEAACPSPSLAVFPLVPQLGGSWELLTEALGIPAATHPAVDC